MTVRQGCAQVTLITHAAQVLHSIAGSCRKPSSASQLLVQHLRVLCVQVVVQLAQGTASLAQDQVQALLPNGYTCYPCYTGSNEQCGCVMPLKQAPKASESVVHCSSKCKAAGTCCMHAVGCAQACKAPQCTAHGVTQDSGCNALVQSLRARGYNGIVLVQFPIKLDPVHNVSRKKSGSKHGTGGQYSNETYKLDIALVKSSADGLVAVEMQGSSHNRSSARLADAAKQQAAKQAGVALHHAYAEQWQALGHGRQSGVQDAVVGSKRARRVRGQMHAADQDALCAEILADLGHTP